ncbi:exonuclease RecJ [Salinigranum rubrum]|uniref:Exonuclease RecJ n=1 Tax=Salinigranum rubrum TaxID=755307 RepID=A0A2I8VHS9_9EURY|nr:exonuclease RecJ [Salinigranum rubrum]AUV81486.1 exonuclease RecJ [Salinigranum rubrum]
MSTTAVMESPSADAPTPSPEELAARLADAPFVRVVVAPTGSALAASGVIARALRERGVPFQVRVRRASAYAVADDALTLRVGSAGPADLTLGDPERAPAMAFEVARALETGPDPTLALAGIAAGEADPATSTLADRAGLDRSPGVGLPVSDLADGLGHTTLLHGPVSGDADAAGATLAEWDLPAELDADAWRRVASLVAVDTTTASGATPRAAEVVSRALNPLRLGDGAPFATVEGYGDVLSAVAREEPGTGVALALGYDARTAALGAWRTHAKHAHATLRDAETARYGGVFVVRVLAAADPGDDTANADDAARRRAAGRLRTVARLARDFRSPEPTVLVVSEGVAAAATHDDGVDVARALSTAVETGSADGTAREADVAFDGERETFETAARGSLS